MQRGDSGSDVRRLQKELIAAGFNVGPSGADGQFGPDTERALRKYQRSKGMEVDGSAGPKTLRKLGIGGGGKKDKPVSEKLAQEFGWAAATIEAIPEIESLFRRAVAKTWTPEKFQLEIKKTNWYKKNGDAARVALSLKTTDPATWNQQVKNFTQTITNKAAQMGASLSAQDVRRMSENYFTYGWDDANLTRAIGKFVKSKNGTMFGVAGAAMEEFREYAAGMGVTLSQKWLDGNSSKVAMGTASTDTVLANIRQMAVSTWPQFKDRILAGESVSEIAEPYIQQMAATLELSPESITLKDKKIKAALSARGDDGKPSQKSVWQFEQDLRKDPRWRKTAGAQEQAGEIINGLGQLFGKAV
jgi:peptidoglycan hydrolase-like protein with peptidoglycan-binding domain